MASNSRSLQISVLSACGYSTEQLHIASIFSMCIFVDLNLILALCSMYTICLVFQLSFPSKYFAIFHVIYYSPHCLKMCSLIRYIPTFSILAFTMVCYLISLTLGKTLGLLTVCRTVTIFPLLVACANVPESCLVPAPYKRGRLPV